MLSDSRHQLPEQQLTFVPIYHRDLGSDQRDDRSCLVGNRLGSFAFSFG